jgi:hypothetical protein
VKSLLQKGRLGGLFHLRAPYAAPGRLDPAISARSDARMGEATGRILRKSRFSAISDSSRNWHDS